MEGGVHVRLLEVAGVRKLLFQLAGPQLETGFTIVAHEVGCTINRRNDRPRLNFPLTLGYKSTIEHFVKYKPWSWADRQLGV